MKEEKTLDISWQTIFKIVITFFTCYLIYLVKDILIWLIFAFVISLLFNPAIDFLQNKRVSRFSATIFVYLCFFGIFCFLIFLTASTFLSEIRQLLQFFPQYFEKFGPPLKNLGLQTFNNFEALTTTFQDWLLKASTSIFSALISALGGLFSTFTIFTLAIFLSLEAKGMGNLIRLLAPKGKEDYFLTLFERSQKKISSWFGVRLLTMFSVGLLVLLTSYIFNLKYPVLFAFLAGIFDIIPIIGPTVAGAIIFTFTIFDGLPKALFFLIAFILIQQIEGNILTPFLTNKFVGLPPILVLISVLIGGKLFGIFGAMLSIPLAGVIYEILAETLRQRKEEVEEF